MSRKLRLGVLVSGGGQTMLNIADCIDRGDLPAREAITTATVAGRSPRSWRW